MLRITKSTQPSGRPQVRNSGIVRAHSSRLSKRLPGFQQRAKEGPANGTDPLGLVSLGGGALVSVAAGYHAIETTTTAQIQSVAEVCKAEVCLSLPFTSRPLLDSIEPGCALKAPPLIDIDTTQSVSSQDAGAQSNQPLHVPIGYIGPSLFTMAALSNAEIAFYVGLAGSACFAYVAVVSAFRMWQGEGQD